MIETKRKKMSNIVLVSKNEVKSLSQAFIEWAKTNSQRISSSANTSYFLRDDLSKMDIASELRYLQWP